MVLRLLKPSSFFSLSLVALSFSALAGEGEKEKPYPPSILDQSLHQYPLYPQTPNAYLSQPCIGPLSPVGQQEYYQISPPSTPVLIPTIAAPTARKSILIPTPTWRSWIGEWVYGEGAWKENTYYDDEWKIGTAYEHEYKRRDWGGPFEDCRISEDSINQFAFQLPQLAKDPNYILTYSLRFPYDSSFLTQDSFFRFNTIQGLETHWKVERKTEKDMHMMLCLKDELEEGLVYVPISSDSNSTCQQLEPFTPENTIFLYKLFRKSSENWTGALPAFLRALSKRPDLKGKRIVAPLPSLQQPSFIVSEIFDKLCKSDTLPQGSGLNYAEAVRRNFNYLGTFYESRPQLLTPEQVIRGQSLKRGCPTITDSSIVRFVIQTQWMKVHDQSKSTCKEREIQKFFEEHKEKVELSRYVVPLQINYDLYEITL